MTRTTGSVTEVSPAQIDEIIDAFQIRLGFTFQQRELLQRALTHSSYANEINVPTRDNERLEFLGDAVLEYVTTDMLFHRFPDEPEGYLTQLRAAIVRNESLAELGRQLDLGSYLLVGRGEDATGGRERDSTLSRAFEALLGAVYLDQGLMNLSAFLQPMLDTMLDEILLLQTHRDARSVLQEMSQEQLHLTPEFAVVDESGPPHLRVYTIDMLISDVVVGRGTGPNKRSAAQEAARDALEHIEADGWPEPLRPFASGQHPR